MIRLFRYLIWLVGVVLALVAAAWWMARPTAPDAFYRPPADLPSNPGVLLRHEAFERGVAAGARAWRILYTTTRPDVRAAVASAIVLASRAPYDGPRPVIAWTHGTTGVVPGCAPSVLDDPFANVPALRQLIDNGWIFVGTDYVGQGTPGPHPYLIGEGEARSALDSIRALRQFKEVRAGESTVVWGHSQGGHAALWTGIVAPTYAPDVNILGIAAVAPASDLRSLLDAVQGRPIGRIMSSFVLRSYGEAYPDVTIEAYVSAPQRWLARDIAGRCLAGREAFVSLAEALLAGGSLFDEPPTTGPLGERLAENTPNRPLRQPLLIAQGLTDDLVLPDLQSRFVRTRCAGGQALEYRTYAGRDHVSVVAPDSPLVPDLVRWTRERLDRVPLRVTCE
jgi:alpha-beta hydrolase superfamily lysophospholipase